MAFPTAVRRGSAVSATSNSTTWTPSFSFTVTNGLNTAISLNDPVRWYAFITSDGNPTLTNTDGIWSKVNQGSETGGAVTGAMFTCATTAAYSAGSFPNLVISSTASEQYSGVIYGLKAAANSTIEYFTSSTFSQNSTFFTDPPSITNNTGGSIDATIVCSRQNDGAGATWSAGPTNYINLIAQLGGGASGASTATADRDLTMANTASEDPGTASSNNDEWTSWTVAFYEVAAARSLIFNPTRERLAPHLVR